VAAGCPSQPAAGCAALRSTKEQGEAQARIDAAQKAVLDSQFSDVAALVELARLQLRRDAGTADAEGPNDAARAKKNAMRAVAVDPNLPAARLVLALSLARSLRDLRAERSRGSILGLIEASLLAVPPSSDSVGAAVASLRGLIAIERGDVRAAKGSFEQATTFDPALASGWIGLGNVARATGAFDEASKHYERASALTSGDPEVLAGLAAAKRREEFLVPGGTSTKPLSPGALLEATTEPTRCDAKTKGFKENAELCKALDEVARAKGEKLGEASRKLLEAIRPLEEACRAKRPECGPHVASAYLAAARGFRAAGALSKAVATLRLLVGREAGLPEAEGAVTTALSELGDAYFSLGVFDEAAAFYEKYAQRGGPLALEAQSRALHVRVGLGQAPQAQALAIALVRMGKDPTTAADGLLAVAGLLLDDGKSAEAEAMLSKHRTTLEKAGAAALADSLLSAPARPACGPLFGCGVLRLAGEERWSAGARAR
jgi:tetratricopeptide (TPR) repeat protein